LVWGEVGEPASFTVLTPDGAALAVWDSGGARPAARVPTVVLPHCWGCTHEIWVSVARRLIESGHRVVLYDQRGHGATTRGTAPLTIETLGRDLAVVLEARKVKNAVLAGHSMGGMTIMSLATYQPDVLAARARALVLVATAAANASAGTGPGPAQFQAQTERFAAGLMASPALGTVLGSRNGYRFVRGAFGVNPSRSHMDLTAHLFGSCDPAVRAGWLVGMATMNLMKGIASISLPTTVMVGSRDRLTGPARAAEIVNAIPGAQLITLPGRGHMLPLEATDDVVDAIVNQSVAAPASVSASR